MVSIGGLVKLYEHCESVEQYLDEFQKQLGIRHAPNGRMYLENQQVKPDQFSFTDLCEAFCGRAYLQRLRNAPNGQRGGRAITTGAMEAVGGGAMGPSMFQNINAWLGTVGGLLGASMLEGYQQQEFIGDQIMGVKTGSRFREAKRVRYTPIKDHVKVLQPGEEVPTAEIDENWIKETKPVRRGGAVELTREAVHHDWTDSLIPSAKDHGYQIREDREERQLKAVFGVANNYERNGTGYNTYQTATPYVNKIPNELLDETNIDKAWQTLTKMVDPDTGRPITFSGELMLVSTAFKRFKASRLARATNFRAGESGLTELLYTNRDPVLEYKPFWSQRVTNLLTTDDNGNGFTKLSEAQAQEYWVLMTKGAFEYVEQWPFIQDTWDIVSNASLGSRGVLLRTQGEEYGEVTVVEPRRAVMSYKN